MTSGSFDKGSIKYSLGVGNEHDMQSERGRESVRRHIGLCPQFDVLWDECTPEEHLRFFALLKGIPADRVDDEVYNILAKIRLPAGDARRPVGNFSGGNKRKVSLAMALVGNPQVVFLDEPTSGMDPASRRGVWDVLQSVKEGRSIVLCTHFMDEADMLGDKIGIMAEGKMAAIGSSLYLKHAFGRGYSLTVRPPVNADGRSSLDSVVKSVVASALKKSQVQRRGRVLQEVYELPVASQKQFPALLRALKKAGVKDITVGQTTLEEVFLEVARRLSAEGSSDDRFESKDADEDKDEDRAGAAYSPIVPQLSSSHRSSSRLARDENSDARCLRRARSALMICDARWKTMSRSPNMIVTQVVIPIVMVFLAFGSVSFLKTSPYVVPPLLSLTNLTTAWSNSCTTELTGFGKATSELRENVKQSMRSFAAIHEWETVADMEKNLSASLSSTKYTRQPSCGGLIYTDQEHTDSTGRDTFPAKSIVLAPNSSLVPSAPLFLNIYTNAMFASKELNATVSTSSHPLPYHVPQVVDTVSLFLPMFAGMGFLSSGLGGLALVADRESHRRVVLRLRGLSSSSYILGQFLFDVGLLGIPLIGLSVVLIYVFQCHWLMGTRLLGFLVISLVGTIGTASLGYATSSMFKTKAMASRIVPAGLPAVTVIPFVIIFVLTDPDTIHLLSTAFCVCPPFALQEGIKRLMAMDTSPGSQPSIVDVFYVLRDPILLATAFTFISLLRVHFAEGGSMILCESCRGIASRKRTDAAALNFHDENETWRRDSGLGSGLGLTVSIGDGGDWDAGESGGGLRVEYDDDDVSNGDADKAQEDDATFLCNVSRGFSVQSTGRGRSSTHHTSGAVSRIRASHRTFSDSSTNGIRVRRLIKEFGGGGEKVRAVDGLSLEVRRGELVAFLGPNGAGKTTTMSILSTELEQTFGEVRVAGLDVSNSEERNVLRSSAILGFCPQFDALYESLTVMEHFALWNSCLSGEIESRELTRELAEAVGLGNYLHVHSSKLSGGNKRKLSIALALLGAPDVVLLDEPSTGVDVAARRVIWNLLHGFREHAAILLSTHSMEEATAISDRIVVVVKGKVAADGTVAELQQKHGDGFVLEIASQTGCGDQVAKFVVDGVLCGTLKERFDGRLKFVLDPSIVDLASAFETMENADCGVKFFSISHATMEDVFMNLLLKNK